MTKALFISDLHLSETEDSITQGFFNFLKERAARSDALFILGDLFEYWIGDDDLSAFNQSVIQHLRELTESGTSLYIQVGNRDFLLGQEFAKLTGAELLAEEYLLEHNGRTALLMHGDSLCLDDEEYQQFRQMVRQPQWQKELLGKPLEERRQLANSIREESKQRKSNLAENIMDVSEGEVDRVMKEHQTSLLIHGHTHRPATHTVSSGKRMVLGDWSPDKGWLIEWDGGEPVLKQFRL